MLGRVEPTVVNGAPPVDEVLFILALFYFSCYRRISSRFGYLPAWLWRVKREGKRERNEQKDQQPTANHQR